jgi:peptidoglycan/LPS O-acetylase OafA/YrhL
MQSMGNIAPARVIAYRPDVDGLRAVAVLSVVIFHLSKSALPGGYLGVDIFFLLSGFLITSIIWHEVQDGAFSIAKFYDRRIRRIMPAMLVVLFASTIVALLLLLPTDLMGYSRSLLATLAFVANVYFWRDTDYFSRAAEEKPLLHLWSLSVEEQFYIFFPIVLVLLARWWRRGIMPMVVLLTVGSLIANIFLVSRGGGSPAFFLLPTRAWELGLGAVLALLPAHTNLQSTKAHLVSVFGGILILVGIASPHMVLQISPYIPVAFPAVLGAALLIFAGREASPFFNRLLSLRGCVWIGLISYSLYLWHWPIVVFSRYYLTREFSDFEMWLALGVMFICAIGSWHFVEQPLRSKRVSIKTILYLVGAGVVLLVLFSVLVLWQRGLPSRLNAEAAVINQAVGTNYRCPVSQMLAFGSSRACLLNLPTGNPKDAEVVLLGNSHAQMYAPVWTSILKEHGMAGLLVPVNGCLPTTLANISVDCIAVAKRNLKELLELNRSRLIILGITWWYEADGLVDASGRMTDNRNNAALVGAIEDLAAQLRMADKQVILIGPIAQPGWDVASTVSRQMAFGHPVDRPVFLPASEFGKRFQSAIQHFDAHQDLTFTRPDLVQCSADRCSYILDGHSLFADSNHIAAGELQRFHSVFATALSKAHAKLR